MKKLFALIVLLAGVTFASNAQTNLDTYSTSGYIRSNGTYVQPSTRTKPNNTNLDNFSTTGNYNPYTSESGTRARDYSSEALNYGAGKTIETGSRGGIYYKNSNGNKTYVPKRTTSTYPFD